MMRMGTAWLLILCHGMVLGGKPATPAPAAYSWKAVEEARQRNFPATALGLLDEILTQARRRHDEAAKVRALAEKAGLLRLREGDMSAGPVRLLRDELPLAGTEARPFLQVLLAQAYREYLDDWEDLLEDRSILPESGPDDFRQWDPARFRQEIEQLYEDALKSVSAVRTSARRDFARALGWTGPAVRPEILVADAALDYYSEGKDLPAHPSSWPSLEEENWPALLGTVQDFIRTVRRLPAGSGSVTKCLDCFARILSALSGPEYRSRLVWYDLERIRFIHGNFIAKQDSPLAGRLAAAYRSRLEATTREYRGTSDEPDILLELSKAWEEAGDFPRSLATAWTGSRRFPAGGTGKSLHQRLRELTRIQMEAYLPRTNPPGPVPLVLQTCNVSTVYYRIYPAVWQDDSDFKSQRVIWRGQGGPDRQLRQTPLAEGNIQTTEAHGFQPCQTRTALPAMPAGFYSLWLSSDPAFQDRARRFRACFWISRYSVICRQRVGVVDGFILDTTTGLPAAGAGVFAVGAGPAGEVQYFTQTATDTGGRFVMPRPAFRNEYRVLVQAGGEELLLPGTINCQIVDSRYAWPERFTIWMTDRSIYRPGQTVRFKGIAVRHNLQNHQFTVIPGETVQVRLLDPEEDEAGNCTLTANDFGSVSGQLSIPPGRLTGDYRLECEDPAGSVGIKVEEYRRPTFTIELEAAKDAPRPGESVILQGHARYYHGAPVDQARFSYRLDPVNTDWLEEQTNREPGEGILTGTGLTGKDGKIAIPVPAMPAGFDAEGAASGRWYSVWLQVTDRAGESREFSRFIPVSASGIQLTLQMDPLPATGNQTVEISARNNLGQPVAALGRLRIIPLLEPSGAGRLRISHWGGVEEDLDSWKKWPEGPLSQELPFTTGPEGTTRFNLHLNPGAYSILVEGTGEKGIYSKTKYPMLVMPASDSGGELCPVPAFLGFSAEKLSCGQTLEVDWGTRCPAGRCMLEVNRDGAVHRRLWSPPGYMVHRFRIPVDDSLQGGFKVRTVRFEKGAATGSEQFIDVPWKDRELDVHLETVRNVMEPGESGRIVLTVGNPAPERPGLEAGSGPIPAGGSPIPPVGPDHLADGNVPVPPMEVEPAEPAELAAVMYDVSLDRFMPHVWSPFSFFPRFDREYSFHVSSGCWQKFPVMKQENTLEELEYQDLIEVYVSGFFPAVQNRTRQKIEVITRSGGAIRYPEEADVEVIACGFSDAVCYTTVMRLEIPQTPAGLPMVNPRRDFRETAIFVPHLNVDGSGQTVIDFTFPDSVTRWKFQALAHTKDCRSGVVQTEFTTRRKLMIQASPPRFVRAGDRFRLQARITNMTEEPLNGEASLEVPGVDPAGGESGPPVSGTFRQAFLAAANSSRVISREVKVPSRQGTIQFIARATAAEHGDAEEGLIPVLPVRRTVTESIPFSLNGPGTRSFSFSEQPALTSEPVTSRIFLQWVTNPAWFALQALPVLAGFPHECSEQIFHRLFARELAAHIIRNEPELKSWIEQADGDSAAAVPAGSGLPGPENRTMPSPWNQDLDEAGGQWRETLVSLRNPARNARELEHCEEMLKSRALPGGGWAWYAGQEQADLHITCLIVAGRGRLQRLGIKDCPDWLKDAIGFLDGWLAGRPASYWHPREASLTLEQEELLYARSFFTGSIPFPPEAKRQYTILLEKARRCQTNPDRLAGAARIALVLHRLGEREIAMRLLRSIREYAASDPDQGFFWPANRALPWSWQDRPVETQVLLLEAFHEIENDPLAVSGMVTWLLRQRRTAGWGGTVANAAAVYGLLLSRTPLAAPASISVLLDGRPLPLPPGHDGSGLLELTIDPEEINPGSVMEIRQTGPGRMWGGIFRQSVQEEAETVSSGQDLKVAREYYRLDSGPGGRQLLPVAGPVAAGERIVTRLTIQAERDMAYIYLQDDRPAGLEPAGALSGSRESGGIFYYLAIRDDAHQFYLDRVPAGLHVLEYECVVQQAGVFQTGLTEAWCMYAPEFRAVSPGRLFSGGD